VNATLVELDLASCGMGPLGGAALGQALVANGTLQKLDLSHNGLSDDAKTLVRSCVQERQGFSLQLVDYAHGEARILTADERQRLSELLGQAQHSDTSKFGSEKKDLIAGSPEFAARGLWHYMCVQDPFDLDGKQRMESEVMQLVDQLKADAAAGGAKAEAVVADFGPLAFSWPQSPQGKTAAEVAAVVEVELKDNLHYVLHCEAGSSTRKWQGGLMLDCDEAGQLFAERQKDGKGVSLADFAASEMATQASLSESHIAALRVYTTAAYKYINGPLRNQSAFYEQRRPHPLPVIVAFISEAVKKLRAAYTQRMGDQATVETRLWRGMKNLDMTDDFLQKRKGGTELAPMSTTTKMSVAADYAMSSNSLLFALKVNSFMQYGAPLSWLSAFPGEEEVLYPPLTYLQPTYSHTEHVEVGNCIFHVLEAEPHLP